MMMNRERFTEEELKRQNETALADSSLNITATNVEFCRKWVDQYEKEAAEFKALAETARPRQRGAYKSHETRALNSRDQMAGNLALQLEWLRRHRPEIYDEVK